MPAATSLIRLPEHARLNDPQAQGRMAAMRTYANAAERGMENDKFLDLCEKVMSGPAPEAFKSAYAQTISALSDLFSRDH